MSGWPSPCASIEGRPTNRHGLTSSVPTDTAAVVLHRRKSKRGQNTPAKPFKPGPKETVGGRQAKSRAPRSLDDGELVSESDDFQVQQDARSDQEAKGVKERDDDGRHDRRLSEKVCNLN